MDIFTYLGGHAVFVSCLHTEAVTTYINFFVQALHQLQCIIILPWLPFCSVAFLVYKYLSVIAASYFAQFFWWFLALQAGSIYYRQAERCCFCLELEQFSVNAVLLSTALPCVHLTIHAFLAFLLASLLSD